MPALSSPTHSQSAGFVPDFADALASARQFLLTVANAELPAALRAKGGASDLVQDTFVAAHRARDQFAGRTVAELRGWLRAILLRELAMFRRKYRGAASRDVRREVAGAMPAVAAADPGPVSDLIRREQDEHLAAAVARLPHEYRFAVVMRVERRLGFAAIGRELGRSEDAARGLFARALELLRVTTPGAAG